MSVIATALKHMLAAGMPAEAIIEAVAAMEAELVSGQPAEKPRSKAALRQERYVARKKAAQEIVSEASENVTNDADVMENDDLASANVSDDADGEAPLPPPPLPFPQTPNLTPPPPTPPRGCAGTREAARAGELPLGDGEDHEDDEDEPEKPAKPEKRMRQMPDDWTPAEFGEGTKSRAVIDGWPPGQLETEIEHFTAHHRSRGNKFKDWQDAWKTWVLGSRRFSGNGTSNRNTGSGFARPANRREEMDRAVRDIYARQA